MRISDWSSDVCSSDLGLNNRTKDVRLADIIAVEELREQLDHVRTLRFQKDELIWLRGQTFYGVQGIFSPGFIHELELLQLPEYELSVDKQTGQFRFETQADWIKSTWWEIHAMQRSEEHTSELQSLMRISYAVFCLKKK